jgi:hypothetical protein
MAGKRKPMASAHQTIRPADLEDGTVAELTTRRRLAQLQIFEEGEDLGERALKARENEQALPAADRSRLLELVLMASIIRVPLPTGLVDALAFALGSNQSRKRKKKKLPGLRLNAIEMEAREFPDPTGRRPSVLQDREITRRLFGRDWENHRRTVAEWRKKRQYWDEVARLRTLRSRSLSADENAQIASYTRTARKSLLQPQLRAVVKRSVARSVGDGRVNVKSRAPR